MNKFMLSITASSGEFYQGDCEDLTLPISDGIYGVQAGHNPVLVALHMGILHFVVDGKADDLPEWAFFNVGPLEEAREKAEMKLAEEKGGAV